MNIGPILVQTVRHFFPDFTNWLDAIPDSRFAPFITYSKRFLVWWGLTLFLTKLGSRRQLDHQLGGDGPQVLTNVNRLAGTEQDTCPANKTLEYFLGKVGADSLAELRCQSVNRLIRMKVLDEARVQGRFAVLIDGSGYLTFGHRHCPHCLTRRHGDGTTTYMHQVLEAKVIGPAHTVFSIATEFIDNRDIQGSPAANQEQIKQDCELKALRRLANTFRADFPQLRTCLVGDGLYACGEGFQIAKDHRCDFIYVFKEGRTPALWQEFQALLKLRPEQRVETITPSGAHQVFHWMPLHYRDSDGRDWFFMGTHLVETKADGTKSEWAWVTSLKVNRETVVEVAATGRQRWCVENEGFNSQKNSGLNMEHAYSHTNWAAYYFLLQIAHMILQLVEKGSLLRHLAMERGLGTAVKLFGSLKNMAQRLLESLRYMCWPDDAFDVKLAGRIQIRIDSS